MRKSFLLYVIIAFICLSAPYAVWAQSISLPVCETYMYAERDSALYLDVYHPAVARKDKAAVITLFGGGFYLGTRNNKLMQENISALLEKGFTVISIDYRLGLRDSAMVVNNKKLTKATRLFEYCVDIAVEDCADAIAWTCSNAKRLDIDPDRIILTGSSAGAITVLQLDYYRANSSNKVSDLPQNWKPAAVVPYSGGLLCHKKDLKYLSEPAPTMMVHGTKDKIVAYKSFGIPFNSKMYGAKSVDKAMNRQDIPHWIIRFDGYEHEVASWLPGSIDLFCTFVDLTLSGRTTTFDATMTDSALKPNRWTGMTMLEMYGARK